MAEEYRVIYICDPVAQKFEGYLNNYAREGWFLASLTPATHMEGGTYILILRRPIEAK